MGRKLCLAVCTLNQWAMDFKGNLERIRLSILEAKKLKASFRLGPELEITGYGCNDHFLESDTLLHSWEVLVELLTDKDLYGILCDIGMPVMHKTCVYNCRVIIYNGKIYLIRPKMCLAIGGNYREARWFNDWPLERQTEAHTLPRMVQQAIGQDSVPFGDAVISTVDTCVGSEVCQELWAPETRHVPMSLDGVEIMTNGSGSHHELRKSQYRLELIRNATNKCGGIYVYSNMRGCDGERLYFDGGSCIAMNGRLYAVGKHFSVGEVEVVTACLDLEDVRTYRNLVRHGSFVRSAPRAFPRVAVPVELSSSSRLDSLHLVSTQPIDVAPLLAEVEIAQGPACWLWDYLRRSGCSGFLLPLSGGVDSASVACIVYSMCRLLVEEMKNEQQSASKQVRSVRDQLKAITGDGQLAAETASQLASQLLFTCYMGSAQSSEATRRRAGQLARQIGCFFTGVDIEPMVRGALEVFRSVGLDEPCFAVDGGSAAENLALQNIQARSRMVLAYLFAQLAPAVGVKSNWSDAVYCGRRQGRSLLVLGTGNVDECLRGYLTKYDCSSADINPIGSISKTDLRSFILYCRDEFGLTALDEIIHAAPTAELVPLEQGQVVQTDEQEMGMSYADLSLFGRLRKQMSCGPYSMFSKLVEKWSFGEGRFDGFQWKRLGIYDVAEKVKHFFRCYAINRHKTTTMTPSYHAESYSPEDNRFDLRQFLYNVDWTWQFRRIDEAAQSLGQGVGSKTGADQQAFDGLNSTGRSTSSSSSSPKKSEANSSFATSSSKQTTLDDLDSSNTLVNQSRSEQRRDVVPVEMVASLSLRNNGLQIREARRVKLGPRSTTTSRTTSTMADRRPPAQLNQTVSSVTSSEADKENKAKKKAATNWTETDEPVPMTPRRRSGIRMGLSTATATAKSTGNTNGNGAAGTSTTPKMGLRSSGKRRLSGGAAVEAAVKRVKIS